MEHSRRFPITTPLLALAIGVALAPDADAQGAVERVSVASNGAQADAICRGGGLSADGRFVVFYSAATTLVAADGNASEDVFLRDRLFGATECISRTSSGAVGDGRSHSPAISGDGRWVVYISSASDLVPGDIEPPTADNASDVFLRDRGTGTTTRLSRRTSGAEVSGQFGNPAISADGRVVVFESSVNLATGANSPQIWAYDVQSGALTRVDASPATFWVRDPVISADGRFIAYRGYYEPTPNNITKQIFVRDMQSGANELVSVFSNGLGNRDSERPSISADGRFVAFESAATNDAPSPVGSTLFRIWVRDRSSATTELVSVNSLGVPNSANCYAPILSNDGRRVAFQANEPGFVPNPSATSSDTVVFDRVTRSLSPLGTSATGQFGDAASGTTAFRADGGAVLLTSAAGNLVAGDGNGVIDVFVKDLTPLIPVNYCTAQTNSQGCVSSLTYSGLPSTSLASPFFVEARELINRRYAMLFYGFAPNAAPFNGGTLCVASPLKRTAPQPTGGNPTGIDCSGAIAFDFNALIRAGAVPELVVGTVVYAQVTYSDIGGAFGRAQSDGLTFTVLP